MKHVKNWFKTKVNDLHKALGDNNANSFISQPMGTKQMIIEGKKMLIVKLCVCQPGHSKNHSYGNYKKKVAPIYNAVIATKDKLPFLGY
jgi:hypothetical protein